jgi:hypothetical protein
MPLPFINWQHRKASLIAVLAILFFCIFCILKSRSRIWEVGGSDGIWILWALIEVLIALWKRAFATSLANGVVESF